MTPTPFVDDPDFRLFVGDALGVLREFPDASVDCCVTSPPYWALRDYGTGGWEGGDPGCDHRPTNGAQGRGGARADRSFTGSEPQRATCSRCGAVRVDEQIGLEETPDEYVARLVEVFREVRRVLVPTGTLWLNLGDSYSSGGRDYRVRDSKGGDSGDARSMERGTRPQNPTGIKSKELVGIPWRVAFALQADGWWLRSEIIWDKPNPMPESVTDRPTKSHEQVFLFAKSERYFYDQEAVREPFEAKSSGNWSRATYDARAALGVSGTYRRDYRHPDLDAAPQEETLPGLPPEAPRGPDGRRATKVEGRDGSAQHRDGERWPNPTGRNLRSVWRIATRSYAEAHFATFPEELPRKCVAAGVPERVCRVCGKPSERITKRTAIPTRSVPLVPAVTEGGDGRNGLDSETFGNLSAVETVGWTDCGHGSWRAGVVLDPFSGAGTTALVARKLGRAAVGIELSEEYARLSADRLSQLSLFAEEPA